MQIHFYFFPHSGKIKSRFCFRKKKWKQWLLYEYIHGKEIVWNYLTLSTVSTEINYTWPPLKPKTQKASFASPGFSDWVTKILCPCSGFVWIPLWAQFSGFWAEDRKLAQWGHLDTRGERPHEQTTGTGLPEEQAPRFYASVMLIWFVNSVAPVWRKSATNTCHRFQREERRSAVTLASLNKQTRAPVTAFGGRHHQFLYI